MQSIFVVLFGSRFACNVSLMRSCSQPGFQIRTRPHIQCAIARPPRPVFTARQGRTHHVRHAPFYRREPQPTLPGSDPDTGDAARGGRDHRHPRLRGNPFLVRHRLDHREPAEVPAPVAHQQQQHRGVLRGSPDELAHQPDPDVQGPAAVAAALEA